MECGTIDEKFGLSRLQKSVTFRLFVLQLSFTELEINWYHQSFSFPSNFLMCSHRRFLFICREETTFCVSLKFLELFSIKSKCISSFYVLECFLISLEHTIIIELIHIHSFIINFSILLKYLNFDFEIIFLTFIDS